ncbi:MAG: M23 family metallopeptidase, partial [Deltaproteobacteria bacterium]|nr:M23 family metallopeptidase [Deltaproteobacteria bacterium]
VSVSIEMTLEDNVVADRSFPFEYVVPPNTVQCIARISRLYKDRDFSIRYSSSWMVGDFNARHSPKDGYRLPWQLGEYYQVSQAYGGTITTHTDRSSRYAVDFGMPVGTPVLAARSGTVVNMEDSFSVGALDKVLSDKANFVDILHDDGTIATYAHLAVRSVAVRLGQRVSVGEKLGLSGSTGYSSGPHLHFSVWRPEKGVKGFVQVSLPVEFCMDDTAPCAPVRYGTTISSGPTASPLVNGSSAGPD